MRHVPIAARSPKPVGQGPTLVCIAFKPVKALDPGHSTHQGSASADHLQSDLEEFTILFNRRTSRSRGHIFRRLLERTVATGPVTETALTHGYDW